MMLYLNVSQNVRMGLSIATLGFVASIWLVTPVLSFAPCPAKLLQRSVSAATNLRLSSQEGGLAPIDPSETAVLICKFQNDFATEGGKIYDTVKEVIMATNMKENSKLFVDLSRKAGCTIVHCPISLEPGQNAVTAMPFGVVERIRDAEALAHGTWGAEITEEMSPVEGDIISPKYGMCAFQTTDLDETLRAKGIKNVIVMGFLTNGSVESTIRTAFERCYNVYCPIDCVAACSMVEQQCSIELNFGLFAVNADASQLVNAMMS